MASLTHQTTPLFLWGAKRVGIHLLSFHIPFSSLGVASFTYHAFFVRCGRGFINRPRPLFKLRRGFTYLLTTPFYQVWACLYLLADHAPISSLVGRGFSYSLALPDCRPRPLFKIGCVFTYSPTTLLFFWGEKDEKTQEIIERLLHMVFSYSIFPTFKKPKMPYHYYYYERKIITA